MKKRLLSKIVLPWLVFGVFADGPHFFLTKAPVTTAINALYMYHGADLKHPYYACMDDYSLCEWLSPSPSATMQEIRR